MAITKTHVLENGSSGNYFKIVSCQIDRQTMVMTVILSLFKEKSFTSKVPIANNIIHHSFIIQKSDLDDNLIALGYAKIMEKGIFASVSRQFSDSDGIIDLTNAIKD